MSRPALGDRSTPASVANARARAPREPASGRSDASRSRPPRRAIAGLVAAACAALVGSTGCGPAPPAEDAGADAPRFAFVRAPGVVVRLDSTTGASWFVAETGDGGWVALGSPPADDANAEVTEAEGRYGLFRIARGRGADDGVDLVRLDRATGRTWLITPRDGAEWTEITDAAPAPMADTPAGGTEPTAAPSIPSATDAPAPGPRDLNLMPRERFGDSPEDVRKNVAVVVQALEKEGLPVEIKVWGARQLGVLDPDVAVPPLVEALRADEPEVVVAAIESLQQLGATSTIPEILKLADHPDPRVRDAVSAVVVEVR